MNGRIITNDIRPWSIDCLLNAFYIIANYVLWRRDERLHWTDLPFTQPPPSLLLYDYSFRYHLDLTCITQLVRTVSATRHMAAAFDQWSVAYASSDVDSFVRHMFDSPVVSTDVHDMITDGQRLHRLEIETAHELATLVVALDWHRLQATPDAVLTDLVRSLFGIPAVQALMLQLPARWPVQVRVEYDGMCQYSED